MRSTTSISGKVKKRTGSALDSDRYEFISLSNAEPDLGLPSTDNSLVLSKSSGVRRFVSLGGILSYDSASATVSADSSAITSIIDSAYVQARQLSGGATFDLDVTDAGGLGSLVWDSDTSTLTYTGPSESTIRGLFSGGTGLTYTSGTGTFSLTNTGVSAATYGDSELVPVLTINGQGQITSASTTPVKTVSNLDFDSATGNLTITLSDGSSVLDTITLDPYTTTNLSEGTNLYFTTLRAHDAIATYDSNINTTGSIVAATFEGDGSALTGVKADNVVEEVKNVSGGTLVKGTPVYPTGAVGNAVTVIAADASDSDKMPAIGVLAQDLADDAEGSMIISGKIVGVNTSGNTAGDVAYVGVGGGWSNTPPTGEGNIVQALGYFTRIDSSNGGGVVELGDERSAPNLANGNILLGTDGGAPSPTTLNTTIVPEGTNLYYTTVRFDSDFGTKSTTDLTEGTNLYYTTVRADSDFDVRLATKTTDDLTEGSTNLYFDSARNVTISRNSISVNDADGLGSLSYSAVTGIITYNGPSTSDIRNQLVSGSGINYDSGTGVISHADTSSQASVNNSNGTVIQDITLDGFGHITSLASVDLDSRYVNTSGDTMTGFLTLHSDPTNAFHAATKEYVDNVAQGVKTAPSVLAATTANLVATYDNGTAGVGATLTSTSNGALPAIDSVDGWELYDGILVKDQDSAAHNGRYFVADVGDGSSPWILERCPYCDEDSEIPGSYVFVNGGATYEGTGWIQIVSDPNTFTVGTDNIVVTQFSGAGTYVGGDGINITGNVFSIDSSQLTTIIQNIDGAGSGIDADLLDGEQGSYYRINIYNSSGVLQN